MRRSDVFYAVILVTFVVAVFLVGARLAEASLRLSGDARPRHSTWAAQSLMPLPDVRVRLYSGYDPMADWALREMYLPQPGWGGWTYWDERVLLYHELGHFYAGRHVNRAERDAFRAAVGSTCEWWGKRCRLPAGEMFAEMYSACSLGMTVRERDSVPSVSYGWEPPYGSDAALCALIRSFS